MNTQVIPIKVKTSGADAGFDASLKCYIPEVCDKQIIPEGGRRAIIICPGGGYSKKSNREAEPIALKFACEGICAFVLDYSVLPAVFPQALCEAAEAVSIVRNNASRWQINPDKIFMSGFSAGGHLAASLGVFFDSDYIKDNTVFLANEIKPNGLILCYPVITGGEFAHKNSFECLSGKEFSPEIGAKYSLERYVTKLTPPTFIWHTFEDNIVPVENSILFFSALRKCGVNTEMHIFPHGVHGLALSNELTGPEVIEPQAWVNMAVMFIKNL